MSIIIPVYDRGELLPRTLKSVVNQTYGNIEIIVIDDGSSEDIKSIADSFNDPRIRYIRHDRNMGIAAARNTGLREAKGEFIEFLDSDDEYLPEKTKKQLEVFFAQDPENGIEAVYCGLWREINDRKEYCLHLKKRSRWFFMTQQIMIRKSIIKKNCFFDENFVCAEDLDYVYRLSRTCKFAGIPEPLAVYYDVRASHSKNWAIMQKDHEMFLEKHYDTLLPAEKSYWFYGLGKYYMNCGRTRKGYGYFFKSYTVYPLNGRALRKLVRYAPLVLFYCLKNRSIMIHSRR